LHPVKKQCKTRVILSPQAKNLVCRERMRRSAEILQVRA
jgi:hypothetical protein